MPAVFFLLQIGIGLLQFFAVSDALHYYFGLNKLVTAAITTFIVFPIIPFAPIIGAVLGILGAIAVWNWQWYWAVLLYSWPMVFALVVGFGSDFIERISRRSRSEV